MFKILNSSIEKAYEIALEDLRSCYTKEGILASHVNFSDYWARDTFWASLGMLETKDPEKITRVQKSIELFLNINAPTEKSREKSLLITTALSI